VFWVVLVLLILQIPIVFDSSAQTNEKGTYYVATNGDDANPGTLSQPWRTVQHAADMMVAGDTVLIRSGIYNEQIITVHDGDATDGYITFSAYPDETPVIDGTGVETGNNGFVIENSYIKILGLEIRNWNDGGISVWTAGFLEISDCKIHHVGGGIGFFAGSHDFTVNRVEMYQIFIGGFDASPADGADCYNGVISDCVVHDAQDPDQNSDGFALGHGKGHNFVFDRCEAYNVWDGFDISNYDVQINSCSSHDIYNVGYKLWDDNITLTNCLGYNCETSNLQLTWNEKPGTVTLQNCDFTDSKDNNNIWVQNPARHLHMYNCILAGGDNVGLDFEQLGADTYQGDYNIFHNDNPDRAIVVRDKDSEFSLDMIAAGDWASHSGEDQSSMVCADPASQLFTDYANRDFHLKQGSIAVDAGTQNNAPNVDYDGVSRPQGTGYDIGAYEYGSSSSQSTPTSSTPKPSPTSTTEEQESTSLPLEYIVLPTAAIIIGLAVTVVWLKRRGTHHPDS
jgi:hypothetical protein